MSDIDPTDGDVTTSPKRICSICGKKLSRFNTTGYCFHHPDPKQQQRKEDRKALRNKLEEQEQERQQVLVNRLESAQRRQKPEEEEKPLQLMIVDLVCEIYGIEFSELEKPGRKEPAVHIRQILMYLLYMDTSLSYPSIGKLLGGRDHTTVIHAVEQVSKKLEEDAEFRNTIRSVRAAYRTSS